MPIKLVSVAEMVAIEKQADAAGITYPVMMENAGRGLAEVIAETYGYLEEDGVLALVGSGNNGGDALVALTYLAEAGWPAIAYLVRPRPVDDSLVARFQKTGGLVYLSWEDEGFSNLGALLVENGLLVDGVLGTGFRLPLKAEIGACLDYTRQSIEQAKKRPIVVAVDCPSGVDCDNGHVAAETIPADLTVTMAAIKHGLLRFPANNLVGELILVGIGLPEGEQELPAWKAIQTWVADADWVRSSMPRRPNDAHKGSFGTALILAGCVNYTGAAWLAGQAAYRIGAGLVTLGIPEPLHATLAGQFPEATWLPLANEDGFIAQEAASTVLDALERVTALLFGPGFGLQETTEQFIARLFGEKTNRQMGFINQPGEKTEIRRRQLPPLVIDADGLKLLARLPDWPARLPAECILTPHPGEMSILTGLPVGEIQADRIQVARQFSQAWSQVVVLKGAFTVVAAPDGRAAVIPVATAALARAGTGDVLAGLAVGLRAQGVAAFEAAVAASWIHAQAGWRAAEQLGNSGSVLASDLLPAVVQVISEELA